MMKIINLVFDLFFYMLLGSIKYARRRGVKVGENCRLYTKNWGSEPFLISMGDNVTITSGVKLITHDGSTCLVKNAEGKRYQRFAPIEIGSNVFIGVNSIIMPGVTIGSNVVIGAGSVVTKDIPDDSVAIGVPAKVVSSFADYQVKIQNTCANDSELAGITNYFERVERSLEIQAQKSN
ncbi:acyltransferase [Acinetobacter sp. C_4_1]|uniref:acyltransferase n=1 Tax=unclassified Acinetobacter TaxID=196816 RepID=UPI0021B794E7|nr:MULTISPECIES: acyltransferase [unclassified Acinetobacter]MCT8089305.1 acyltransferase [Acinetobacter sp. F_3_1]MCT8096548.1 acyltransferase [Acinetobacter sp. C_3_1]MCT8100940.1 acyltransferase [Acinetobacter sp. C_4_1]MCT8134745.1 acyltransferase [Acinetobacter sp. T_3_1]